MQERKKILLVLYVTIGFFLFLAIVFFSVISSQLRLIGFALFEDHSLFSIVSPIGLGLFFAGLFSSIFALGFLIFTLIYFFKSKDSSNNVPIVASNRAVTVNKSPTGLKKPIASKTISRPVNRIGSNTSRPVSTNSIAKRPKPPIIRK